MEMPARLRALSPDLENCTVGQINSGITDRAFALGQITVKIIRAHGGCLGTRSRRRAWTTAISHGEVLNDL
jgi:hypothetical protein